MAFDPIFCAETITAAGPLSSRERIMAFADDHEVLLERLDEELRESTALSPRLFAKIIAGACTRLPSAHGAGKAAIAAQLIEHGALTDAAFALIELELPEWKIRRLICEHGEWLCSLTRQPNLPVELDDTADAVHEILAVAVLRAFVEVRRRTLAGITAASVVPKIRDIAEYALCDNFV
jgi:hypothetical protein